MRTRFTAPVRATLISFAVGVAVCVTTSPASGQGVGIGGRLAWVKADSEVDVDRVRFVGGQIRLLSPRIGLEVSIDRHSETFDDLDQKVTETPIQASLLLRMGGGSVSPYLLGGPGWYRLKVAPIDDPDGDTVQTTEFGWHGGPRPRDPPLATVRHPRRLPTHVPRLRRR
jgi:hypothetical protein